MTHFYSVWKVQIGIREEKTRLNWGRMELKYDRVGVSWGREEENVRKTKSC